jgi:hypothetical protein
MRPWKVGFRSRRYSSSRHSSRESPSLSRRACINGVRIVAASRVESFRAGCGAGTAVASIVGDCVCDETMASLNDGLAGERVLMNDIVLDGRERMS